MAVLIICFWALLMLAAIGSRADGSPHTAVGPARPLLDGAIHATLGTGLVAWAVPMVLSIPNALTSGAVGAAWLGAIAAVLAVRFGAIRRGLNTATIELRGLLACPVSPLADRRSQILGRMGEGAWRLTLAALFVTTFAAALLYPSNIWDSQAHHLPRIAQFEQNHTVAPFPTYYPSMNSTYPFTSMVMTQIALLNGSLNTHLALLQWFAYAMSAALVNAISVRLGSGRMGARFATLLALSTPAVALQATATQYDLTLAMWALIAVHLSLALIDDLDLRTAAWLGVTLGLGLSTKISMLLVFGPFALWLVYRAVRSSGWRRTFGAGLTSLLLAGIIATPLFTMNLMQGGNLLGTGIPGNAHVSVPDRSLGALWTNGIRNLSVLMSTPSEAANGLVVRAASAAASLGGVSADSPVNKETADMPYALSSSAFNPDQAGAPLTVLMLLLSLIVLTLSPLGSKKPVQRRHDAGAYALCVAAGLVAIAVLITWQPFIVRTMTASLLLLAPIAGVAIGEVHLGPSGSLSRAASISLWAILGVSVVYGLAAVTFSATSPLAPRSALTGGPRTEVGWWNTPYADRGWAGSLAYFVDDLDAAVEVAAPLEGAPPVALIGGDAALALPVFPMISDLRDLGYLVIYEPRFGPSEVPGFHRDLLRDAADQPTVVISFDPVGSDGTTRVDGEPVGSLSGYLQTLSREVEELSVTVNVFVPVR